MPGELPIKAMPPPRRCGIGCTDVRTACHWIGAYRHRCNQAVPRSSAPAPVGAHAGRSLLKGQPRQVRFYNDSKATSLMHSITALQAFAPGTAIFIVGGYDKHVDMSEFETLLTARTGGVVGIGQTGQALVKGVGGLGTVGSPLLEYAGTLETAMLLTLRWCKQNTNIVAVVLSPASASYGQFSNYEQPRRNFRSAES